MADSARRALVVGATGIVGQNLGTRLAADGWEVHGLSRSGGPAGAGVHPVRADLTDPAGLRAALDSLAPQLVAITAWSRWETEKENIVVNGGIGNATWKRRRVLRDFRLGAATIPFERVVTGGI